MSRENYKVGDTVCFKYRINENSEIISHGRITNITENTIEVRNSYFDKQILKFPTNRNIFSLYNIYGMQEVSNIQYIDCFIYGTEDCIGVAVNTSVNRTERNEQVNFYDPHHNTKIGKDNVLFINDLRSHINPYYLANNFQVRTYTKHPVNIYSNLIRNDLDCGLPVAFKTENGTYQYGLVFGYRKIVNPYPKTILDKYCNNKNCKTIVIYQVEKGIIRANEIKHVHPDKVISLQKFLNDNLSTSKKVRIKIYLNTLLYVGDKDHIKRIMTLYRRKYEFRIFQFKHEKTIYCKKFFDFISHIRFFQKEKQLNEIHENSTRSYGHNNIIEKPVDVYSIVKELKSNNTDDFKLINNLYLLLIDHKFYKIII